MRLVTNTGSLAEMFGDEETIRLLASIGFDGIDWSFFGMLEDENRWNETDFRERAEKLKAIADECGIKIVQAHAPFPTARRDEVFNQKMFDKILCAMEAASIMGVENIVVHPITCMDYLPNHHKLFEENVRLYRGLVPYCEKWNIRVCAENMWQRDTKRDVITFSVCAQPEEFSALLDAVDSPWVVGCLDIGHAAIVSVDPVDAIKVLGAKRLKALHVHDVDYLQDSHMLPFTQKLDWGSITKALGEIGYDGDFTFEADFYIEKFPKELRPDACLLMARTGRYLIERVMEARNNFCKKVEV